MVQSNDDDLYDSIEVREPSRDNASVASSVPPNDPDARDLHDQEKAQRIEHEDLSRENKQVGRAPWPTEFPTDYRQDLQGLPPPLASMAKHRRRLR